MSGQTCAMCLPHSKHVTWYHLINPHLLGGFVGSLSLLGITTRLNKTLQVNIRITCSFSPSPTSTVSCSLLI